LSAEAAALAGYFDAMDKDGQEKLLQYAKGLIDSGQYKKMYRTGTVSQGV
jgi:hypothetical protein